MNLVFKSGKHHIFRGPNNSLHFFIREDGELKPSNQSQKDSVIRSLMQKFLDMKTTIEFELFEEEKNEQSISRPITK